MEDSVIKLIPEFKFEKDEFDNYFYIIKKSDGTFSDTMFISHLDTIDRGPSSYDFKTWDSVNQAWIYPEVKTDNEKRITHLFEGDFVKTDGKTNLGADDKAGVTIMINMMSEGIPGLYYFFVGEESGCIGSSSLSRVFDIKVTDGKLPSINRCISFDRRGYGSVITHQMGNVCCSDEFAKELSEKLNEYGFWFKPDSTGIYTDSAEFIDVIPECTNLSVGYFSEHTTTEKQDIEFLELLAVVLTKIEWDSLKTTRNISNVSYKGKKSSHSSWGGRYGAGGWDWDGDGYSDGYGYYKTPDTTKNTAVRDTTLTSKTFIDKGKGNLEKVNKDNDDTEFDRWYFEQKSKGWSADTNSILIT